MEPGAGWLGWSPQDRWFSPSVTRVKLLSEGTNMANEHQSLKSPHTSRAWWGVSAWLGFARAGGSPAKRGTHQVSRQPATEAWEAHTRRQTSA